MLETAIPICILSKIDLILLTNMFSTIFSGMCMSNSNQSYVMFKNGSLKLTETICFD